MTECIIRNESRNKTFPNHNKFLLNNSCRNEFLDKLKCVIFAQRKWFVHTKKLVKLGWENAKAW